MKKKIKLCLNCFYYSNGFCKNLYKKVDKDTKVCGDYLEHPDSAYKRYKKQGVLIDLDVLTVSLWDGKKEASNFLEKIKKGEFKLYIPSVLIELVSKWDNEDLKKQITDFYNIYAAKIISTSEIIEKAKKMNLNYSSVIKQLEDKGIKDEDAILIFVTSIFEIGCLVTFNRKHLRNKKEVINKVLKKNKMNEVDINAPI